MIRLEEIQELDRRDPLAHKRAEFLLPQDTVYLDGNSLGPMPFSAQRSLCKTTEQEWGEDLVSSWNKHNWIGLPTSVGEKIAVLLGAGPGQTIACDSTSVNLFKLLAAALQINAERSVILSQADNFPTDLYMAEGLNNLLGNERCRLVKSSEDKLISKLDESVAVLLLTQVNFRSGKLHDIEKITRRAHQVGALVIWDLAHSAGALPLELDKWRVDFAVGCGYKYLNGGPGAPAFLYVAERHHACVNQPLKGWMGHAKPFDFDPSYSASNGVQQFLSGTPNILSLAALDGALDVFEGVDMASIRKKSLALADLFIGLVRSEPGLKELELITPENKHLRGSQLAYRLENAHELAQALIEAKVVVDFRRPDCIRFGFMPLYTQFADVYLAVQRLTEIVTTKYYQHEKFKLKNTVT